MPWRPARLCVAPGCVNAQPCPLHPVNRWATGTPGRTMPDHWPATRRRILRRDTHRCYKCGAFATEVDHVDRAGGEADWNLKAICTPCHKVKSASEGQANRW